MCCEGQPTFPPKAQHPSEGQQSKQALKREEDAKSERGLSPNYTWRVQISLSQPRRRPRIHAAKTRSLFCSSPSFNPIRVSGTIFQESPKRRREALSLNLLPPLILQDCNRTYFADSPTDICSASRAHKKDLLIWPGWLLLKDTLSPL